MRNQRSLVIAAGIAALLIPASAAQAATKQVTIGPAKPLKGVPPVAFDADFYPRTVTIAKGDHIRFKWTTGFGDVIFVPEGQDAPSFAMPAGTVAGAKDEAGADMWFNGQPSFAPNMEALSPQGGKVIDGSKVVGSGFSFEGPMKPWKVRFTKAGTYRLTSVLMPLKKLTVTVKKNGNGVPGKKADKRRLAKQVKASTKLAKKLVAFEGPEGNVVRAGNDAKGIAQIAFFPAKKTVKVGDTVKFEMSKSSRSSSTTSPSAPSRISTPSRSSGRSSTRSWSTARTRRARRSASTAPTTATATSTPGSWTRTRTRRSRRTTR